MNGCLRGEHETRFHAVDQQNGWEMRNCVRCRTTVCVPIVWVSPHPGDYVVGHEENAWGAFR